MSEVGVDNKVSKVPPDALVSSDADYMTSMMTKVWIDENDEKLDAEYEEMLTLRW